MASFLYFNNWRLVDILEFKMAGSHLWLALVISYTDMIEGQSTSYYLILYSSSQMLFSHHICTAFALLRCVAQKSLDEVWSRRGWFDIVWTRYYQLD